MNQRRSVTLRDVAAKVGVTPAAVSMALTGHNRISTATAERIRVAADELGYVGSSAAKALRARRSDTIAVVVPNSSQHVFGHLYFMHVLTGVSAVVNARDFQVLISTNSSKEGGLTAYERVLRSRTADGAIVTSAGIDDPNIGRLASSGLPVVLIGNYPEFPHASTVSIDDFSAAKALTRHLIEVHGRQNLFHVAGPSDHRTGLDRQAGFLSALEESDISADGRVVAGDFSESSGAEATERLVGLRPDGIVFANDDMAFGGMQTLKTRRLAVPEDVSIVGFDDFGVSRATTPGITTVHVPAEAMARVAAERLFNLLDAESDRPSREVLPTSLTIRASCGCHEAA